MPRACWLLLFASLAGAASAADPFRPVGGAVLDRAAFTEWVDGQETAVPEAEAKGGPSALVWGEKSRPEWRGVRFGEGRSAGVRHLRLGFAEPVALGSVLVRGGGALSVLKPTAAYPGQLADEGQWLPAERLVGRAAGRQEVGAEGYALWVLPPGTQTRALRFSHTPSPGDRESSGYLGGVWLLAPRLGNLAPQALAQTVARDDVSAKLVDETNNRTWGAWENSEQGAPLPISREHPAFITLTWPRPVSLSGVCLLWTGFADVEVEAFGGAAGDSVSEAPDTSWQRVASRGGMDALYPMALGPNWVAFDQPVTTRALRLRITKGARSGHPHLSDKVKQGRRIWLGEVLAVAALADNAGLASLVLPAAGDEPPPIPVRFKLPAPGYVTLVIEDQQGKRIRNLVSETPFPAGDNTAWWDGSDDLLRDPEAARHGLYHVPTRPVAPGTYRVRGLWREPLKLRYEFSIYNAGRPAWPTADGTGCWLTTHTPPTSVATVPGSKTADGQPLVFLGAFVAEGGHGLQWLREDGTKLGGQGWVGGTWTGAPTLAVDRGAQAVADHLCYVGSVWDGELRLTAKTRAFGDQPVLKHKLGDDWDRRAKGAMPPPRLPGFEGGDRIWVLGGIAAHDGRLVCSLARQNELLVVDINGKQIAARVPLANPRGLAFDAQGRLLAISGQQVVRFAALPGTAETIVAGGLEDPRHLTVEADGNLLVTDRGSAHQVKRFSPAGRLMAAIGRPGAPASGPYDPLHLNHPSGLGVDSQGRVWVAEADDFPRRVSLWSARGALERAFYGPTEYGGGGVLDPRDRTRFYYKGLEFRLDWERGSDQLARVFWRPQALLDAHYGHYSPDTPLYAGPGPRRYFTSCYTHTPTNGDDVAFVWLDGEREARLVAALGKARSWDVLRGAEFRARWPQGARPEEESPRSETPAGFAWTDANGDGRPQPAEVQFVAEPVRGVTVMDDLAFVVARCGEQNVRFAATLDADGLPRYDLTKPQSLGPAGGHQPSSGGNQALTEPGGWTITTNASLPFSPYGLGGKFQGAPRWSYPSPWPGLHASHEAAVPDRPGMVVGHTRLLGGWVRGPVGPMFCVNGNMGNMYLLTADGLFVGTLFHDIRLRPNWAAPVAVRGMDVTDVSLHDENFWPSITQTADGQVYLVDGARTSLVRVDGLDTLKRLPEASVTVTPDDLRRAADWYARAEARRQEQRGSGLLTVVQRAAPPNVDGRLDDWPATTDWAFIDRRGTLANFNSDSRPYEVSAAVTLTATHLYAAWRTTERNLLNNSGETPNALFKHGGCLDLMLATDPRANPTRATPVPGDQRLLVTRVGNKPRALLYRAKVPGATEPVAFSSPWRTITIDAVEDVTAQIALASDNAGVFELSIPLAVLRWQPLPGETYRADLGVLRGAGGQTTQRVYWANKATAITADVPSEAELTPRLWGKWRVVGP